MTAYIFQQYYRWNTAGSNFMPVFYISIFLRLFHEKPSSPFNRCKAAQALSVFVFLSS